MSRTEVVLPSHPRRRRRSSADHASDAVEQSLGHAIEVLLSLVIVLSPLAFGSVEYWAQNWMMIGVGLAMLCLAVRWLVYPRTFKPTLTVAYVPIVLFLLLVVLQWAALPAGALGTLSPKAADAWAAAATLAPAEAVRQSVSLYPLATERQLRMLVLLSGVFFIVLNHYRDREQILRLLAAIVLSGAIVGAIAISQNLRNGTRSDWLGVQAGHPDSGTFLNHSHFGQFMNLAIGAALAILLVGLKRQVGDRALSYKTLKLHLMKKGSLAMLLPALFILIAPVLVALSLTRGGVLSLMISGAIAGVLLGLTQSGKGKRSLLAVIGFLSLLVILKFGFDAVYDRMATLRNVSEAGGGIRLQMIRDMLPIVGDYPLLGTGLGTFAHVFPAYDTAAIVSFATHAENEYAQLAVETGLIGIALIAAFAIVVLFNAFRAIRIGRRSMHAGIIGLLFGFLAILIHSLSDFGQHVPAVAFVTAAIAAIIVRLGIDAREDAAAEPTPHRSGSNAARVVFGVAAVAVMAGWGWMLHRGNIDANAEAHWMSARRAYAEMEKRGLADASDGEFILALQNMSRAVELAPGDADYRYGLNVTRWQSISRYDPAQTREFLERISQECRAIASVAPAFGPPITFAGQIVRFDLDDQAGESLIREGYRLSPNSPEASFAVASLDAQDGKWEDCMRHLRRSIDLGVRPIDAANLLADRFQRTDLALSIVEGSRPDMMAFADTLDRLQQVDAAAKLRDEAAVLLVAEANRPDAPIDAVVQLAEAYMREREYASAVPLLRRALAVRYDRSDWRTRLIAALTAQGQIDDALREARMNLQLNPGDPAAQKLIEEIVLLPTSRPTSQPTEQVGRVMQ